MSTVTTDAAGEISGFLTNPKHSADGGIYRGRFVCPNIQWTGQGEEALATFTITAEELTDAADSRLLWTDQAVQRGIRPDIHPAPPRELAVGDGYPDPKAYIFNSNNADEIAEKLLRAERLFLTPLIWNLRPGQFEAYADKETQSIYIYSGKIYLPDSHHRQQGIIRAVHAYRESSSSYPKFNPSKQFKIELYFLTREDEGNYFFDKNQRPQPTSKSKAFDLTTLDDLSILAKRTIERSQALRDNVNRVTDRLTPKNPQVITLSTLREMMKSLAPSDGLDEIEIEGIGVVAGTFYDLIYQVRPELGHLDVAERKNVRENLIVDAATMMHGYAYIMKNFNEDTTKLGLPQAERKWLTKLERLSKSKIYKYEDWHGDIFDKKNPLWQRVGVVKPGRDGRKLTVLNTGAARSECGRVLRQLMETNPPPNDIAYLARI
ncbi:DNA sulfur modification protein DndB [Luteolibacter sp. Populi]|uniref:DNA sulfur modification protein DndB n=1 Tax=Luteolibacter sp. Populi TaxID=3230487 RepID=UPI0034672C94